MALLTYVLLSVYDDDKLSTYEVVFWLWTLTGTIGEINELDELSLLRRFCSHLRELQPHVIVTYNGDSFDWPYIDKRMTHFGLSLKAELGFGPSAADDGKYYLSSATTHIDAIHWVKRDSYLPAGSHGLKVRTPLPTCSARVTRAPTAAAPSSPAVRVGGTCRRLDVYVCVCRVRPCAVPSWAMTRSRSIQSR